MKVFVYISGLMQPLTTSNAGRKIALELKGKGLKAFYFRRKEEITTEAINLCKTADEVALSGHSNGAHHAAIFGGRLERPIAKLWMIDPYFDPWWMLWKNIPITSNVVSGASWRHHAKKLIIPPNTMWDDYLVDDRWHGAMDENPVIRAMIMEWMGVPVSAPAVYHPPTTGASGEMLSRSMRIIEAIKNRGRTRPPNN